MQAEKKPEDNDLPAFSLYLLCLFSCPQKFRKAVFPIAHYLFHFFRQAVAAFPQRIQHNICGQLAVLQDKD